MTDIARMVGPAQWLETSTTHAACTVTVSSSADFPNLFLVGFEISASAAPAAAVVATITGLAGPSGTIATKHVNVPANAFADLAVLYGANPLVAAAGQPLVLSVPDLGASVVCTATLYFRYGP